MTSEDDPERIDEEALAWIARATSGAFTDRDHDGLRSWLAESDGHRRAYAEARALWQDLEGLKDRSVVADTLTSLERAKAARNSRRRWRMAGLGLAASVLLGLVVIEIDPVLWWRAEHLTAASERRTVHLPDGGVAHLNSRTALASHYTVAARRIELLAGEAEFVVHGDARRSFVVAAGPARIEALGTDFLVRRDAHGTTIAVVENAVQVNHAEGGATITVRAGEEIRCDERRLGAVRPGDIARLTAWRRGKLVFESTPLAEVIVEINQHRPGHVALMSPELRAHLVSGVFAIDKIDAVLAVISKTLPVRSYSVAGRYVVLY